MQITDDLLKAYKAADHEQRTYLFLEYRDLRELFNEIDENELFFLRQPMKNRRETSWLSRLVRAAMLKWSPG